VSPWRHSDTDSSNRFHPSGNAIQDLISSQIRGVSNVFMSNAASPGCNLYYGCPDKDYGLVKAKIATSLLGAGKLETYGAWRDANGNWQPARDYLAIGNYAMLYRAQNFSRDAAYNDFDVRLTVQEDGSAAMSVVSTRQVRDLARTDTYDGIFAVRIPKANADYTVTLELVAPGSTAAADEFTNNNKKVFRFRSYTMQ
jgi:hypothetical protein